MTEKIYKPIIKNFMKVADVRVIQDKESRKEYVVCKDIFEALGLVYTDENGNSTWGMPRKRMLEFLEGLDKICDVKTFYVTSKSSKTKSREAQNMECIDIETVPIVLTQFKPTARRGEEALKTWFSFMKFVNMLLQEHEVYKYLFGDKDNQKDKMGEIIEVGGNAVITNNMINKIMGELIVGENSFPIKKDELKIYQPLTTIDLLTVRNVVLDKFTTAFEFTGSHKEAYKLTTEYVHKKYKNNITENNINNKNI